LFDALQSRKDPACVLLDPVRLGNFPKTGLCSLSKALSVTRHHQQVDVQSQDPGKVILLVRVRNMTSNAGWEEVRRE
jgi:hypothetical protein